MSLIIGYGSYRVLLCGVLLKKYRTHLENIQLSAFISVSLSTPMYVHSSISLLVLYQTCEARALSKLVHCEYRGALNSARRQNNIWREAIRYALQLIALAQIFQHLSNFIM